MKNKKLIKNNGIMRKININKWIKKKKNNLLKKELFKRKIE